MTEVGVRAAPQTKYGFVATRVVSTRHSKTVAAARRYNTGDNAIPTMKDNARRDVANQQQQQLALDVGDHAVRQPSSRAFRCAACDRQFASRKYLSMHIALHKMAAEPSLTAGRDVGTLRRYPRTDSAAQQWSCCVCGKTFAQNSNYRNHMRTHSDERPYVCLVCVIGFKERYHLKKHTLFKHSPGQLDEACQHCGKRFKDLTAVRAHERTHSDARPYACSRCGKTFKTSECLWHHVNRSKTCGRAANSGGRARVETYVPSHCPSSSTRRQRRNSDARCATFRLLPSTTEAAAESLTTSLTHLVQCWSAEVSTSSPSNVACCASNVSAVVASGAKPETEIDEQLECDISALWTTSLVSDGVASQSLYDDNVDVNFCMSANCFEDLIATTMTNAAVNTRTVDAEAAMDGCGEQFWNRTTLTDLSSESDHRVQSCFVATSSNAAFQTVSRYLARRPLTTSDCCMQQSVATCVYDKQSVAGCSTATSAYDCGHSSKQSPGNSQALFEPAGSSRACCGCAHLPTAVVTPLKRVRRCGVVSSPRPHVVLPSPTGDTFHLPPIETFAPPRRPLLSTWS